MKRAFFSFLLLLWGVAMWAQYDLLSAKRNVIPGNYNFWVYTPEDYYYTQEQTPLLIFLHGASLCGHDLNRVLRYGPLDAVKIGRNIPALIIAPQNPGGAWSPKKLNDILEWMKENYAFDHSRVYVLGMSLGGYGTLDFAGTYPEKIAAAMALCGGATLKDYRGLGQLPLWIAHGTADRAIPVKQSKVVVSGMKALGADSRLRYDWLPGASHGALARYFYTAKTYDWLFSHSLHDPDRPVNRDITITQSDLQQAYRDIDRRPDQLERE
ncbi:MAG: dienelactone hydrolase family protein [Bacteroidaceae bacterium]|nr:dienelactone hydrolase family protein [Bacteroidaceae bacterium]